MRPASRVSDFRFRTWSANERQFLPYLPPLVEITRQVFADPRTVSAEVNDDPDVPTRRWVIFRAEVTWPTAAQSRAARDEWYARTAEVCPRAVLDHIGLAIDRRSDPVGVVQYGNVQERLQ